jgi:hypothetical protein
MENLSMSTIDPNVRVFEQMLAAHEAKTQPAPSAKPSRSSRPATADDVSKAVNDALAGMRANSARESYINKFAADIPESYRQHIPVTSDPKALELGEQVARAHYSADFGKLAAVATDKGHLPADLYHPVAIAAALQDTNGQADPSNLSFRQHAAKVLGTDPPTLKAPDQAKVDAAEQGVDFSKMTPLQRLSFHLKSSGGKAADPKKSSSPAPPADGQSGIIDALGRLAKRRSGS